ncbi:hypothetical protein [Gulosibacter faecalis]|uniref:Uncharacterized protein n=1 Tax=Gulosibacter faecalis TaxID=272240 RepID=A0ABW5UV26_9MICO|nr:hypothetical protein [Gulosibacter faecalis]
MRDLEGERADWLNDEAWLEARREEAEARRYRVAEVIYEAAMVQVSRRPAFDDLEGHWQSQYLRQAAAVLDFLEVS